MSRDDIAFCIEIETQTPPKTQFDELCHEGRIVLGEFSERFNLPVDYWRLTDYYRQWRNALVAFIDGQSPVCLVTAMRDPALGTFIDTWVMYAENSSVVLQNQIIPCGQLDSDYLDRGTYEFVQPRETETEDGEPISEWQIPLSAVRQFLAVLQRETGNVNPGTGFFR